MTFPEEPFVVNRLPIVTEKNSGPIQVCEDASAACKILSDHYDLGQVLGVRPVEQGQVNDTFEIDLKRNGNIIRLIFRKYQEEASEDHIRFEHGLLNHLADRGFDLSPRVLQTRSGETFVRASGWRDWAGRDFYFAVFTYLKGANLLNWDRPYCSMEELSSAAEALRQYHQTIFGWSMKQSAAECEIIDTLPGLADRWLDFQSDSESHNRLFQNNLPSLVETLERTSLHLDRVMKDHWPRLAIHGDYHPGNLTFINNRVAGVFDFDWAHIDFRCLDLALAIGYFCIRWNGPRDGGLDFLKMRTFLAAYQNTAVSPDGLGPLNLSELQHLPLVFQAVNLYVLDWILDYHEKSGTEPEESYIYLRHQINLIDWCRRESKTLTQAVMKIGS